MAFASGFGAAASGTEIPIQQTLQDSVQSLQWSPTANLLCAGGWNGEVAIWQVSQQGQTTPMAKTQLERPCLDVAWHPQGQKVFTAGADGKMMLWDLATNASQQFGQHDQPIKSVRSASKLGPDVVVTGSWDKTIKFWDCRTANPVHTETLPERVFAMDVKEELMVVACADKKVYIFQLDGSVKPFRAVDTVLKMQTRCISAWPTKDGFCVGSIEGRVGVQHIDPAKSNATPSKDFSFKCHRDQQKSMIHSVNDIAFHPVHGTFATCGSDGKFVFWDKDRRERLKHFQNLQPYQGLPITSCGFNGDGTLFAYAHSYDWHKGQQHYVKGQDQIFIHPTPAKEIQKKTGGASRR